MRLRSHLLALQISNAVSLATIGAGAVLWWRDHELNQRKITELQAAIDAVDHHLFVHEFKTINQQGQIDGLIRDVRGP